jgi:hypothetical protein
MAISDKFSVWTNRLLRRSHFNLRTMSAKQYLSLMYAAKLLTAEAYFAEAMTAKAEIARL